MDSSLHYTMNEKLEKKYGADLIELKISNRGEAKGNIATTIASAVGVGMPGGYKPEMYLHENKLIKFVNDQIEEYPTKSIVNEDGYLIVTTDAAEYMSVNKVENYN